MDGHKRNIINYILENPEKINFIIVWKVYIYTLLYYNEDVSQDIALCT
jgi:hypothetical protein